MRHPPVQAAISNDEFKMKDTHRIVAMPDHELMASSEGLGWRSVYAVIQREAAYDSYLDPVNDHLFIFHLKGSVGIQWSMPDHAIDGRVTPGRYDFLPGGEGLGVRLGGSIETMHLYLRRTIVDTVIEEMWGGAELLKLIPIFNGSDPFVEQIAIAIRSALTDNSWTGKLYVEQLSWALAAHLVHSCSPRKPPGVHKSGLSRQQLRRVLEFVEANMDQHLDLDDLSAVAGLHPAYFGRLFKRATNMSAHQFVMQRRLERAKQLLASTSQPIAEVAAACGFCHQEHLTRIFRARSGTTPSAYRKAASW